MQLLMYLAELDAQLKNHYLAIKQSRRQKHYQLLKAMELFIEIS